MANYNLGGGVGAIGSRSRAYETADQTEWIEIELSYATVDEHVAHIYERLGVRNAPTAVNKAHLLGLFPRGGNRVR